MKMTIKDPDGTLWKVTDNNNLIVRGNGGFDSKRVSEIKQLINKFKPYLQ